MMKSAVEGILYGCFIIALICAVCALSGCSSVNTSKGVTHATECITGCIERVLMCEANNVSE